MNTVVVAILVMLSAEGTVIHAQTLGVAPSLVACFKSAEEYGSVSGPEGSRIFISCGVTTVSGEPT